MNEQKTNKISTWLSLLAGLLIMVLLSILSGITNIQVTNTRRENKVIQVENYSCDRVIKEDTPAGLIDIYTFDFNYDLKEGQYLVFYTLHQYTEVYIDNELVYAVSKSKKNKMTDTYGADWVVIPLGAEDEGKKCSIIITPSYKFIDTNNLEIFIGPAYVIYETTLKERGSNIFCLGIFTILLGIWRLADVKFMPFLDYGKPTLFLYIAYTSLMMVVPPLLKSTREKYRPKTRIVLDIVSITISSVVIVEVILQLCGVIDFRETLWVTNGLIIIAAILALGCSVYDRIKYRKDPGDAPDKYLTIIIVGGIIDIILYYINGRSTNLICTLVAVNFYVIFEGMSLLLKYVNDQKKLAKQERQLIDKELAIKMSQIQPHFLYNSLTSIHYLCDKDPKLAKKAVKWFSTYLRGNLESMSKENMVPFEQEMNHIDIYLKLEKLRFGEYLEVVYNIEEQDFMVPSLTIQPLVENAVKYGVGDKREGGQVIIGTSSTDTHYIVTIEDTGTGFDINKEYNDGRQHVGIQNVKERLSLICNGELIIYSEIDKGTVAIMRIPKDYGGGGK